MKKSMEHSKNCIFLVLIAAIAIMLAACGDSGDSVGADQKAVDADMEVNAYEDLPSCVEKRYGKVAYISDQNLSFICLNGRWIEYDTVWTSLTDSRDGHTYKGILIGSQIWMAENLNYKTKNSNCYYDDSSTCSKYGRFYTWAAAMDSVGAFSTKGNGCGYGSKCSPSGKVRGVCPSGWHLPSKDEFETLFAAVGGKSTAGKMLKSSRWYLCDSCSDSYSFSVLPAGYKYDKGDFRKKNEEAYFWTSTEFLCPSQKDCTTQHDSLFAYYVKLHSDDDYAYLNDGIKRYGYSVRCVKDESFKSKLSSSVTPKSSSSKKSSSSVSSSSKIPDWKGTTLKDSRDGKTYTTTVIGSQVWMAENLNFKTKGSDCFNNDSTLCKRYGRYYTWAAAKEACPANWHLPSKAEFDALIVAVGGVNSAGYMLKTKCDWSIIGMSHYSEERCGAGLDAYGFSAIPAGCINKQSVYSCDGANFLTSTESKGSSAYYVSLEDFDNSLRYSTTSENFMYSVRCVYDKPVEQSSSSVSVGEVGTFTDVRDEQVYKTVTIGTQTWMAQNLNYNTTNSRCYKDDPGHCTKYGRYYTWDAAKDACPLGWRLPSKADFETLIDVAGGELMAGRMLKSTSGWDDFGCCLDTYSFSALPAGRYDEYGRYVEIGGDQAFFWSSTESDGNIAYMSMYDDNAIVSVQSTFVKSSGFSVRCIKGVSVEKSSSSVVHSSSSVSSVIPSSSSVAVPMSSRSVAIGSMTDSRDGQSYKTVVIGSQTWMAENLNYETANSYCYNDSAFNCNKYGRLYIWAAAMDSAGIWSTNGKGCGYASTCSPTYPVRGVCPTGWHLPTKAEFETLFTEVGGHTTAVTKLKSTSGWPEYGYGTDDYSFSALPAGGRFFGGGYSSEGNYANFWSSTEIDSLGAYNIYFSCYPDSDATLQNYGKYGGFSVRCIKD